MEMTAGQSQALLGHASAAMTARYTTTGTKEVREGLDKLGLTLTRTTPEPAAIEKALLALKEMPVQGRVS